LEKKIKEKKEKEVQRNCEKIKQFKTALHLMDSSSPLFLTFYSLSKPN